MPVISEGTKRRLEREYAPTHPVQNIEGDGRRATLEQMIPHRPNQAPNVEEIRQERRYLPARAVTDDNLDDAYVDFIMYCNPTVAMGTDTSELRKIFRAPPKSDSKAFSTFRLFELIAQLERKEIKTWAQLALDLGVEPPSSEKGQSAQKVQQYSVRLKVSHSQLCCSSMIVSDTFNAFGTLPINLQSQG